MKIADLIKYEISMKYNGSIEFGDEYRSFRFKHNIYLYALAKNISYELFETYGQYDSYTNTGNNAFNRKNHLEDILK